MSKNSKENKESLNEDKYKDKAIRFLDKNDHYELIFMDDFNDPTSGGDGWKAETTIVDVVTDMKEANKDKELHIFVGSYGGSVTCLNLLIMQITQFKHVVGINMGYACSCGFMVLSYCHEIYASPFAMFLFHSMSRLSWGKIAENKNITQFDEKWWKMLVEGGRTKQMLTPEELKLGETSEVWLTGEDLMKRGVVFPFELYAKRSVLTPNTTEFFTVGNDVYRREGSSFQRYVKDTRSKNRKLRYTDIVMKNFNENLMKISED